MIVPMRKLALVVRAEDRESGLDRLRELGVVHIVKKQVSGVELDSLFKRKERLEQARNALRPYAKAAPEPGEGLLLDEAARPEEAAAAILELADEKKANIDAIAQARKELSRLAPWGRFDPADLAYLAGKGLRIRLAECPAKDYPALSGAVDRVVVGGGRTARLAVLGDARLEPPLQAFPTPERGMDELEASIASLAARDAEIDRELSIRAGLKDRLGEASRALDHDIEYEVAKESLGAEEGALLVLRGWIPAKCESALAAAAKEEGWAFIADDPGPDDVPPVCTENHRFVRIIQPVLDFLTLTPGYREYDISPWFLLFFSLFFAMIIGDGGYGAIFLVLGVAAVGTQLRTKGSVDLAPRILTLLSLATVGWGAITGTWFGIDQGRLPSFLKALVIGPFAREPGLEAAEADKLISLNIKHLCFIIGAVQLSLAHVMNIIRDRGSLKALAQVGMLAFVIGLYSLVLNMVLDKERFPLADYNLYLLGIGAALFFLFANYEGRFFKGIIGSLKNFLPIFLGYISCFADIVSYIRLFAVGLAGLAISQTINGMFAAMPEGPMKYVFGSLLLLFGHALNIALGILSVVVHGVRLNVLEFSGHLGMEWSGYRYRPFSRPAASGARK
jgi:V/A-type H+/Na+-transporting ATPase subunit I